MGMFCGFQELENETEEHKDQLDQSRLALEETKREKDQVPVIQRATGHALVAV
jgi:hypothetical protein